MPIVERGMTPDKEAVWRVMFKKEDLMKLKWFHKNQQKLIADAEIKKIRKGLSPEILEEVERMRKERYRNMERFIKKKGEPLAFPDIDPHCIKNVMRAVDPKMTELIYKSMGKDGRRIYLKERFSKLKPEDRYFFPECLSYVYGWKILEHMKNRNLDEPRFGREQVIKNSFYRRNGGLKLEPEYQKPPQENSPTVCGCT